MNNWEPVPEAAGVLHLICEGGPRGDQPSRVLSQIRHANVLDLIGRFSAMAPEGTVAVYTSYPELARDAAAAGAAVVRTPVAGFHFGRAVQDAVRRFRPAGVIALGGGACPLCAREDFAFTYRILAGDERVVVVNAPGSADLIGANHPDGLLWAELPPIDNSLPRSLRALGYRRFLIPNAGRLHFDLDTPTDALVLQRLAPPGTHVAEALADLPWAMPTVDGAIGRLAAALPHVALIGRVPSDTLTYLDMTVRWRLHVLSEQRGLKAQGSAPRGLLAGIGPERLLAAIERVCDCAFFDTRPLAQAWGATQSERFQSDLGRADRIGNPQLRALTRAAAASRVPVVLGGQCLVSGGIWLLAQHLSGRPI